jgi:hypothetical protein
MQRKLPVLVALVFLVGLLLGWAATRLDRVPIARAATFFTSDAELFANVAGEVTPRAMRAVVARRRAASDVIRMKRAASAPSIQKVMLDRATLPRYERLEVTIDLDGEFANPFDPEEIDLSVRFRAPSGREQVVPAFWYRPYTRQLVREAERLTPAGPGGWRARFAPTEVGRYRCQVVARTRAGEARSAEQTFRATRGARRGYLRVSQRNPLYFAFDDGAPWFPIGANVCWSGPRGTFDYDDWFGRYRQVGANYARLWIGPFDLFTLERRGQGAASEYGAGRYDLESAWKLDTVLERAERDRLYLMFCLESFNALRSRPPHEMWAQNPYNRECGGFLDRPEQFFTDARARRLFRNRMRYMVARWGYSPHLFAWEFWNEVDLVDGYASGPVRDWHVEMARYLREIDPWDHLRTTSYSRSEGDPAVDALPEIEFVQTHRYGALDMAADLPEWGKRKSQAYRKPHFIGEFGADAGGPRGEADQGGIHLHNGIWSTALAGQSGTAMLWWWDSYIHPRNLYSHFGALAAFLKDVDWTRDGLQPLDAGDSAPRIAYQAPPREAVLRDLWITPRNGSWEPAPFNRPHTFVLNRSGTIGNEENLARIMHGRRNHPDKHNPATFEVDYARAGQFIVKVDGVSGYGGAGLEIWLDGRRLLERDFADPDGNEKTETITRYGGEYAIDVPAGRHTIRVVNPGTDWMETSYRLPRYQVAAEPPLRVLGLRGPERTLLWVQNLDNTWFRRAAGGTLPVVAPTTVTLSGYAPGEYAVEVWDTDTGRVTSRSRARTASDRLSVALPPIEKDVAVKISRQSPVPRRQ